MLAREEAEAGAGRLAGGAGGYSSMCAQGSPHREIHPAKSPSSTLLLAAATEDPAC